MTSSQPQPQLSETDSAVLLVLLPTATGNGVQQAATNASLATLQGRLGAAIRVLKVDEASHPAVVRSFHATELPSFVLVRQGIELWRQQGLPEGEVTATLLLSKVD
ncbi:MULTISPECIES: thioredoxin domain-containing protein [Hymenobacter]|uniref:Thioredoxin n=1 Tax=Hymenobacter jejuensis TaxID=2502781 RepID=A0A5B8A194_9BACT|nr:MULTISPECIES: thioredoxin [Hymenobacter]MBC6990523.1 thioredoxin [Hymenobacter sp. BT491]QDA61058.1 thioredoxin [Hymenobacter jejuensis]